MGGRHSPRETETLRRTELTPGDRFGWILRGQQPHDLPGSAGYDDLQDLPEWDGSHEESLPSVCQGSSLQHKPYVWLRSLQAAAVLHREDEHFLHVLRSRLHWGWQLRLQRRTADKMVRNGQIWRVNFNPFARIETLNLEFWFWSIFLPHYS